ncbi:MAG: KamA family radical SAM protein [Ruminococcus flavefaciens]|nr:KamA family radical SAM protein [Ruminococcus flavefaciens]
MDKFKSWEWQIKNRIDSLKKLKKYIDLKDEEIEAFNDGLTLPFCITPYFLSLIDKKSPNDPIRLQTVPRKYLPQINIDFRTDYLCEDNFEVAPYLIRRYPYKAALIVTDYCATYCRHCTRQRRINSNAAIINDISNALEYLQKHNEIQDVLLTGGDPLILSDEKIIWILQEIKSISHIRIVRIGSRVPVTLPMRISSEFAHKLAAFGPLYINIHCNHPQEITEEMKIACRNLADVGIILGSQTVLLKSINDTEEILSKLFLELLSIRVKPYYLYQCDQVKGCQPFYVSPQNGIIIINALQGKLSGMAVPKFVIDMPGSMGKIVLAPNGYICSDENYIKLKNFNGQTMNYYC